MTEHILYYCGEPQRDIGDEWWVLLSPEGSEQVLDMAILTGRPIEWLVDLAVRSFYPVINENPQLWRDQP